MIVHYTNQFRKDYKVCKKRGYDMEQLKTIMLRLEDRQEIKKNKDHCLSGDFSGYRECHIFPDWLLIYQLDENKLVFNRTGTHSDLFR